jgi:hypothetical protein
MPPIMTEISRIIFVKRIGLLEIETLRNKSIASVAVAARVYDVRVLHYAVALTVHA